MASIKKNFLYSCILTVSNYIFPLFTYPYISRVLGVSNIGICNFVDSVVNYFILFSMLGMSVVGIREIASSKDNKDNLNLTFSRLFYLSGITSMVSIVIFVICTLFIHDLYIYKNLLFISLVKLIGNFFLIEWFYKGIEEFKYITNRTIIVKLLYIVSVFCFIKDQEDYDVYILLTSLMVAVNALFNCTYAVKYVKLVKPNAILKYFKPDIVMGLQLLLTSMYTSLNVIFLGFVSTTTEVGYYTTATKLYSVIIALYQAYTGVLLPRMSSLHSHNDQTTFNHLIERSQNILITFSIPIILYSIMNSGNIIRLIAGTGYEGAIIPSIIVYPLVFVIGYDQIMMIQILMPLRQDKILFKCAFIGAITGLLLNFLLVPKIFSVGSSISWLVAEIIVVIYAQYQVHKKTQIKFPLTEFIKNIMAYIPMLCVFFFVSLFHLKFYISLIVDGSILILYFYILQKYFIKNELVVSIFSKIKI